MCRHFSLILLIVGFGFSAAAENRTDVLRRLHVVQESYNLNLNQVNKLITQQITSTQTLHVSTKNEKITQHNLESGLEQLASLRAKYLEYKSRIYFIDRLIFQTEAKFNNGTNTSTFFEQQLLEMAYTEVTNADSGLWKFMIHLSIALREIHNAHEDVVGFIESYISYSSVLEPKSPFNFLRDGNYINGAQVQSANPIKAEDVGEAWEEQVKKLSHKPDLFPNTPINEERISLPEILGQPAPETIPTKTIFDNPEYQSPANAETTPANSSDLKLQYDGYSTN